MMILTLLLGAFVVAALRPVLGSQPLLVRCLGAFIGGVLLRGFLSVVGLAAVIVAFIFFDRPSAPASSSHMDSGAPTAAARMTEPVIYANIDRDPCDWDTGVERCSALDINGVPLKDLTCHYNFSQQVCTALGPDGKYLKVLKP